MSLKTRGQQATIRIAVDGIQQGGTLLKVRDFTATPRTTLNEDDYLGEAYTDIDVQHHGWDLGFSVDYTDATALNYMDDLISRFANPQNRQAPPDVTITVMYNWVDPTVRGQAAVYHTVFMKQDEETIGGRKEIIKGKYSGKCQKRELMKL